MENSEKQRQKRMNVWELLWNIKASERWWHYTIYATTTKDIDMRVWNGNHYPSIEANTATHLCKKGTKVLVWTVSRMGDIGITDNLSDANGYHARVEPNSITNLEFISKNMKKIKAVFTGQDGSCGYITGMEYMLEIGTCRKTAMKSVIFIQRSAEEGVVEYESITALLNNWDNIRNA